MGRIRGAIPAGRRGYTIVEVSIVLAISGVLFISAASLLGNSKRGTDFDQVMQDLDSKIQSVANQVKSGNYDDFSVYDCTINGQGRPNLTLPANPTGSNSACTVLGKAIQITPQKERIYIYTVLGLRTDSSGAVPTSVTAAMPEPAMGDNPPNSTDVDLTEEYLLAGSAKAIYATSTTSNQNDHMASFYLAPTSSVSAGQGSTFEAASYPFASSAQYYRDSADSYNGVKQCLERVPANPCNIPTILGSWKLCIHSDDDSRQAILTVTGITGGITTTITYQDCQI